MTYLAGFIVIGVKDLFRSDGPGADLAASPIGRQPGGGEIGKSVNPHLTTIGGFGRFS
jgi:hypothetical protein